MTDWYSDILFDLDEAQRLVFPLSRLVCDVERFPVDALEPMSTHGMGAIYELTSDGKALRDRMTGKTREAYLESYYYPHHRELEEMVAGILSTCPRCLIVDCHSFPSVPIRCEAPERPVVCIGTAGIQTPSALVRQLVDACEKFGLEVLVDHPYSGAMIPQRYLSDRRLESVMIEVRRDLYTNERTGEKLASFESIRRSVRGLLEICQDFESEPGAELRGK